MRGRRVSRDFGFPRWGGYGRDSDAVHVRMCDHVGCKEAGEHPAPKSPRSRERWYFCTAHAAEYNRNWNFFTGMSEDEIEAFMKSESDLGGAYRSSATYSWGGAADADGLTRVERDAFAALELEVTATAAEIKARFRDLAKKHHPDRNPGDKAAEERFHRVRTAYEILRPRLNGGG